MDLNVYSFTGPENNGKNVALAHVPCDSKYASALKFTGKLVNFSLEALSVSGGSDAVIDVNNQVDGLTIHLNAASPNGQFVSTFKGGSRNVYARIDAITGHGSVCDAMLDDWADQNHLATSGITLDYKMADGSAVYVIPLKRKPKLAVGSGPYRFPWWSVLNVRIPFTENYFLVGMCFDVLRRWGLWRAKAN